MRVTFSTILIFLSLFFPSVVAVLVFWDSEAIARPEKVFTNSIGMRFVLIPDGSFMMGSPPEETGRDIDELQHKVTLSKHFYMQTTEVTQGQWRAVMGSNPSYFSKCGDDCPVERVSSQDAEEFARRLNRLEGGDMYRLPTEAEWEYACRAGSATALANGEITVPGCGVDGKLDAMGWYCGNANDATHPVAQKAPNAWGLYDMHGNVWEWCRDWVGYYPSGHVTDPTGPETGPLRARRGGSWIDTVERCRSANRFYETPGARKELNGFRLVMDLGGIFVEGVAPEDLKAAPGK